MLKHFVLFISFPFFLCTAELEVPKYPIIENESEMFLTQKTKKRKSYFYVTAGVFGGIFRIHTHHLNRSTPLTGGQIGFGHRFRTEYLGYGYCLDAIHLLIYPFVSLKGELLFYFPKFKTFHFLSHYDAQHYFGFRIGGGFGLFPKTTNQDKVRLKKRPSLDIVLGTEETSKKGKVRFTYLGINLLDSFLLSNKKTNYHNYLPVLSLNFSQEF